MIYLLDEMRQCESVQACIDLALTDAYGEDEQAVAWLTCIEEMFAGFDRVKVMGQEVALEGFDLSNEVALVAIYWTGKRKARVALESVDFPKSHARRSALAAGMDKILPRPRLSLSSNLAVA